jgi:hypothetical protein
MIESAFLKRSLNAESTQGDADQHGADFGNTESQDKRKGGGGSWRAFVSEFFTNHPRLRGDFRKAAELYRSVKAAGGEVWDRLKSKGSVGTEAFRAGGASFCSLRQECAGPSRDDDNLRHQQGDQRQAREEDAIIPFSSSRREASRNLQDHLNSLLQLSLQVRTEARASHEQEVQKCKALRAWAAQESFPFPSPFDLSPQPWTPEFSCAEFGISIIDLCKKAIQGSDQHLLPELKNQWECLHKMIKRDETRQIPPPLKKGNSHRLCLRATMCMCNRPTHAAFMYEWKSAMRIGLRPNAPLRAHYNRGGLVLQWQRDEQTVLWTAMTSNNLTTLDRSLLLLDRVDPDDDFAARMELECGLETLQIMTDDATLGCRLPYLLTREFDFARKWRVIAWATVLESTRLPTRSICPGRVVIRSVGWTECFWPGFIPMKPKKKRSPLAAKRRRLLHDRAAQHSGALVPRQRLGGAVGPVPMPLHDGSVAPAYDENDTDDEQVVPDEGQDSSHGDKGSEYGSQSDRNPDSGSDEPAMESEVDPEPSDDEDSASSSCAGKDSDSGGNSDEGKGGGGSHDPSGGAIITCPTDIVTDIMDDDIPEWPPLEFESGVPDNSDSGDDHPEDPPPLPPPVEDPPPGGR